MAVPRAGVFLLRAWWEDGHFRGRVTSCLDITASSDVRVSATAEVEEVLRRLDGWLHEFEAMAPPPEGLTREQD